MIKKLLLVALVLGVCVSATGCYGMGGLGQPTPTKPPEKEFTSVEEFTAAVAAAKKDAVATDVENLKGLTGYYIFKTLPDGAKLTSIKVSSITVIAAYTFGQTNEKTYDNQMQIVWYRSQDASKFMGTIASSYTDYKSIAAGDNNYIYINPDVQLAVTADPSAGPTAPTPTPITTKYCQFVYWTQDGAALMAAVPLSFTEDDMKKVCVAQRVDLG